MSDTKISDKIDKIFEKLADIDVTLVEQHLSLKEYDQKPNQNKNYTL